ncbi:MAG: dihydrofolate reductase family protein [Labilithrix sp.]|nr:dihydrofolate reductase family protein [Labilithrix sp.]
MDGYIASAQDGGIGFPVPEAALHRHFNEMQERTALSLYGRNMYEVMKYWDAPPAESADFEQEYARAWQRTPKVVFSTTLESVGPNARLVKDKADVERTVRQLKAETSGDIEVSGTGLAASLIRLGLVDELRLYMMPVVLGGGKPYLEAGLQLELEPLGIESLPQHCTLLRFRPKKS